MEDSSVLFNLKEIMRLEHERIAAESAAKEAAARAAHESALAAQQARERAERERVEREQQAVLEAARAQKALEQEADAARAAALLRVQLETQARERLEQQRLAHEHEQRVRALEVDTKPARRGLVLGAVVVVLAAAAGLYVTVLEPQLGDLAARYEALTAQAAASSAQAEALEAQLAALRAQREREAQVASTQSSPATDKPAAQSGTRVKGTSKGGGSVRAVVTKPQVKGDGLEGLDAEGDDPLDGLGDYPAKKKR